jgi:hypothetical protein
MVTHYAKNKIWLTKNGLKAGFCTHEKIRHRFEMAPMTQMTQMTLAVQIFIADLNTFFPPFCTEQQKFAH